MLSTDHGLFRVDVATGRATQVVISGLPEWPSGIAAAPGGLWAGRHDELYFVDPDAGTATVVVGGDLFPFVAEMGTGDDGRVWYVHCHGLWTFVCHARVFDPTAGLDSGLDWFRGSWYIGPPPATGIAVVPRAVFVDDFETGDLVAWP